MVAPPSEAQVLEAIADPADQILARLALYNRMASLNQVAHCVGIQVQMLGRGRTIGLGPVLRQCGLLTENQLQALMQATQDALRRMEKPPVSPAGRSPRAATESLAPGTTVMIGRAELDRLKAGMGPQEFKRHLVETFLDCAQSGPFAEEMPDPFGPFKGLETLGKGGMARVFKVRDPETRRWVALKVIKPSIAAKKDFVLRFLREASNTALLDHPNIVKMFSIGAVRGRLFFTMELIDGRTVKERMREGRIPSPMVLAILRQTVEGLIAAHEQGIGHRDLKPANIMLGAPRATSNSGSTSGDTQADIIVKLTDFGLARMHGLEDMLDITQHGQFLGTAKYIAPERILGEEPTLQSDIFSLGIMAFQMFSGVPPFRVRNKLEFIDANLKQTPPLLHVIAPEVRPGISKLVDAMLRKDPLQRPTADALIRDIERLQALNREDAPPPNDDPSSVFFRGEVDPRRRILTMIAAVLGLVVVLLLIMIIVS